MDTIAIVLIVVILVLIYVLYAYFTDSATQLIQTANLSTDIKPVTAIASPKNSRYGHSVWLYVNTWDNNTNKVILSRDKNFKLYLDKTSPILKLDVVMNDNKEETMVITNNFPLQKWVNILVSMDNQFADAYIDGKLVRSQRFYKQIDNLSGVSPIQPPDKDYPLYLGNRGSSNFDAYATLLKRWTEPVDPKTAWDNYMKGNGSSQMASALNDMGISITILENKEEVKKFSLL
jgi:hypothetical protein